MSLLSSTFGVFLSVLCDNLLLTVVVPILPELLREKGESINLEGLTNHSAPTTSSNTVVKTRDNNLSSAITSLGNISTNSLESDSISGEDNSAAAKKCLKEIFHLQMLHENSQLGLLFSTKAIMQLLCNPLVGSLTLRIGYKLPLCIGNFILFLCSLVFGFADSYVFFLVGRSFHGLASSLVCISGMALVAELYQNDADRTKFLGRVMGAAALGVLIGYPFGGFTYALFGKTVPFICISVLALFNTGLHASRLRSSYESDWSRKSKPKVNTALMLAPQATILSLLRHRDIRIISTAVWLSTTAMAVLEPTLPVWLIDNFDPPKWQLGLVFVPDSLGYFVGTNFFGQISLRVGRWKMSMMSMAAIGVACFVLPLGKKVWQLAFPHFTLGLGLGIVDASLMPLLAQLADKKHGAGYGAVYALAQTSVALAYSLGPLVGGELVPLIGFPDLIRCIGFINLLFCPFILLLAESDEEEAPDDDGRDNSETNVDEDAERIATALYLQQPVHYNSSSTSPNSPAPPTATTSIMDHFNMRSFYRAVQPTPSQLPYQRFHDQLDSD